MNKLAPETVIILLVSAALITIGFMGPKLRERQVDRARDAIQFAIGSVH